jgi:hypothetical protein
MLKAGLLLLVLGVLTLCPLEARGDDDSASIANALGAISVGTAGTLGVVTAIGNGVIAGRGRRPHLAWRICGVITAAANLGVVGLWIGIASGGRQSEPNAIGFALGHFAIAAVDTAMVVWGWTRPAPVRRYAVSPIVFDPGGRPAIGASVLVAGW